MVKKAKRVEPDENGYVDYGFGYCRFEGPPDNASDEDALRILEQYNAKLEAENQSWLENSKDPQPIAEWLEEMRDSVLRHIDSWITRGPTFTKNEALAEWRRLINAEESSHKWFLTSERGDHLDYVFYETAEDAPPFVLAAITCLYKMEGLLRLSRGELPYMLPRIAQHAFMLGRDIEQMLLLPNAPLVKDRKIQLAAIGEVNEEKRAKREVRRQETLNAIEQAKQENPGREDDPDFLKDKAGEILNLTKRAINKRLEQ